MIPGDGLDIFAACLFLPGDWVEYRCIDSANHRIERDWVLAEHLADQDARLAKLNVAGFNIYAGVNPRIEAGRTTDAGVGLCRTLFCDFDHLANEEGASFDDLACGRVEAAGLPAPTLRVFSGHGVHAYWRLAEAVKPAEWAKAQERLIAAMGSDPTIKNPERIMRLPGFSNVKDPARPVDCFVIETDPSRVFDLAEILSHCSTPETVPAATPQARSQTGRGDTWTRAQAYAAKWEAVNEGQRNDRAFYHAAQIRNDFGLDEAQTVEILRRWNARNDPPLPDNELLGCIKSAPKHAKFTPGAKRDRPRARGPRTKKTTEAPESASRSKTPARETLLPRPVYTRLADVQAQPVSWLWRYRIAYAMLSLLIGIEGLGKTFLALYMAACITTGRPWPDSEVADDAPKPRNVIILTSEDHLSYTIRPRFDKLGGDPARLFALQGVTCSAGDAFFNIMEHLPALEAMIEEVGDVGLILVDPLPAFLGAVDQHKNGEVRVALAGFSTLAERYGCAVLGISHLSKDASKQAIHRTIGSVAFSAAARAVWLVAKDKDDQNRRLFLPVKMNVAKPAKALRFQIRDMQLEWDDGQFDYDADQVLAVDPQEEAGVLADAAEWLRGILADGRVLSTEVQRLARREQISLGTLRRAKARVGVKATHEGMGTGSVWFWSLPEEDAS